MLATVGGRWWIFFQRLTSSPDKHGVRAFIDRVGDAVTCRNNIVISNSHLQSVISGLTSIILVVLGTVSLQFGCTCSHFFCGQFSELWKLKSWVQSGHHVVNFSTWCFGIFKTAHKIWLRILSTALENGRSLTMFNNYIIII